jgi:hypothetical protein
MRRRVEDCRMCLASDCDCTCRTCATARAERQTDPARDVRLALALGRPHLVTTVRRLPARRNGHG